MLQEAGGIEFTDENGGGPGVRLRKSKTRPKLNRLRRVFVEAGRLPLFDEALKAVKLPEPPNGAFFQAFRCGFRRSRPGVPI
jgi:hypothetical protein